MTIPTLREGPRGCGYRKPGGLYLVSTGLGESCERLPLPVTQCPTCGHGVKPARAWTWLNGEDFFAPAHVEHGGSAHDRRCPLGTRPSVNGAKPNAIADKMIAEATGFDDKDLTRVGLLWIGERFYPTVGHFTDEAVRMGVSRRITQVPREFEPGKTWVFLGHRKAITKIVEKPELGKAEVEHTPGIFRVFRPERIEYVVKGDETDEQIEALLKRGLVPVKVERVDPTPEQIESGLVPREEGEEE